MDLLGLPQVRWKCRHNGELKLNTDGSYNALSNLMCTGGLLRDSKGEWQSGFSSIEGQGDPLLAELLAVKNGLNHAWQERVRVVQCESDSAEVVLLLNDAQQVSFHAHGTVINDIIQLVERDWTVTFHHALREANMAADFLAKKAMTMSSSWTVWREPPALMEALLLKDSLGCSS